jgi:hypothetical protein
VGLIVGTVALHRPSWATLEQTIMAIVQTVDFHTFHNAFMRAGREAQYSYQGLRGLFDHLEQLADDTGVDMELDVVAICCDYTEGTFKVVASDYGIDISECADDDEIRETVLDYLNDETMVAWSDDDTVVYAAF